MADSKALPDIYDDVLVFGGGSPATDGPPIAKVGGFWSHPDYDRSYLLAARYVIECASRDQRQNEVALPVAYLQRHALEIALKDLILGARHISADRAWLEALKLDGKAPVPQVPKSAFGHQLRALIAELREALAEIGYGDVPAEFVTLADKVLAVEGTDPTRLRYATGVDGKESFPKPVTIPVGETQAELEQIVANHVRVKLHDGAGLAQDLADEGQYLTQETYRLDDGPSEPTDFG